MSELSSQFGPINPRGIIKLSYGDFVGSNPKEEKKSEEFPLDLNVAANPLFDRCMIVAFFENARYTFSAVEILNSFNVQKSGIGVIFSWVNLTEDSRIVNNLVNNDITRGKFTLFPPYFIVYTQGKAKGFFNVAMFSVDAIYEQVITRIKNGMCDLQNKNGGVDQENVMTLGPGDNLIATLAPESKPILFNTRKKQGQQEFQKQLQNITKLRKSEAEAIRKAAIEGQKAEQERLKTEQVELAKSRNVL